MTTITIPIGDIDVDFDFDTDDIRDEILGGRDFTNAVESVVEDMDLSTPVEETLRGMDLVEESDVDSHVEEYLSGRDLPTSTNELDEYIRQAIANDDNMVLSAVENALESMDVPTRGDLDDAFDVAALVMRIDALEHTVERLCKTFTLIHMSTRDIKRGVQS